MRSANRHRGRLGIFSYHRVGAADVDPWGLCVSEGNFEGQIAVLRARGRVDRLTSALATSPLHRLATRTDQFAVTFDDGYADNLHAALPILERHDVPATVFLATGLIDRPFFWWDVLSELVLSPHSPAERITAVAADLDLCEPIAADGDAVDRADVHERLYAGLADRPDIEIDRLIRELVQLSDVPMPETEGRPLTTAEARELAAHPLISIGAHTVTHPRLAGLEEAVVRSEMIQGDVRLDALFGGGPRVLAYPYGNVSPMVASVARQCGFTHAVSTEERWIAAREDPFMVPRLHPADVEPAAFEQWLNVFG